MIKAHISYVATVLHDRRSDSRVQQFLDHTHDFVFFAGFFIYLDFIDAFYEPHFHYYEMGQGG